MTRIEIAPGLLYLDREAWGADDALPRLGYLVARDKRTHFIVHHTVGVDNDPTPNVFETEAECIAKMRALQVARPDLSPPGMPPDVPYNFGGFLMADGSIIVCEGRGEDRTGAHTHGHNTQGVAVGITGNFQDFPLDVSPWLPKLSIFMGWLKFNPNGPGYGGPWEPMTNLGSIRPTRAKAFGHRDFALTSCPGDSLYNALPSLDFLLDTPEAGDDQVDEEPPAEDRELQMWRRRNEFGVLIAAMHKRNVDLALAPDDPRWLQEMAVDAEEITRLARG